MENKNLTFEQANEKSYHDKQTLICYEKTLLSFRGKHFLISKILLLKLLPKLIDKLELLLHR